MSLSVWIRNHVRGWALESRCLSRSDIVSNRTLGVRQYVMWDAASVALLKKLWASGHSAGQIARRLGHSRNAVCAKLLRMGLKRGHKPPTAKPRIVSMPKRKPALLAACARPVHKVVSARKPVVRPPKEFTKSQLNAMLTRRMSSGNVVRRAHLSCLRSFPLFEHYKPEQTAKHGVASVLRGVIGRGL
jgi:GcrA cell cycle regulator